MSNQASRLVAASATETGHRELIEGLNGFSFELYKRLREQRKSLFFSPFSIWTALAMVYAGARGQTARQMSDVLGFRLSREVVALFFRDLLARLNDSDEHAAIRLAVANAIWAQRGFPFSRDFLDLLESHYRSEGHELDFASDVAGACEAINRWVSQCTRGRIPKIVEPGLIQPLTRMVLTNAVYFKGRWDSPFKKELTRPATFHLEGGLFGRKVSVPMMVQSSEFAYLKDDGVQVLELPYQGNTLSMVLVLPKRRNGLPALEASLSTARLSEWQQNVRRQDVDVFIPRFKMRWGVELRQVLSDMGMRDPFSGHRANLSGMVDVGDGRLNENLFIDEVIHQAFVETNEEGTEAAAATAVVGMCTGLPEPKPVFRADRPFLFLIRHNRTGAILFLGRVANPTA